MRILDPHEKDAEPELNKSKRLRKGRLYGPDYLVYSLEQDPQTVQEARKSMDVALWEEAKKDKMENHF